MRTLVCGLTALLLSTNLAAAGTSIDVDIVSADGAKLRATYTTPGKPGPAMLLIHQCNMDRTAWKELTGHLVDAGVHVLAMDLRGFGERSDGGDPYPGRDKCNVNFVKGAMMGLYALTMNIWDMKCCIDYLESTQQLH